MWLIVMMSTAMAGEETEGLSPIPEWFVEIFRAQAGIHPGDPMQLRAIVRNPAAAPALARTIQASLYDGLAPLDRVPTEREIQGAISFVSNWAGFRSKDAFGARTEREWLPRDRDVACLEQRGASPWPPHRHVLWIVVDDPAALVGSDEVDRVTVEAAVHQALTNQGLDVVMQPMLR